MRILIFLFFLFLIISHKILASEPYALKVNISYRTAACGTCNHRPMRGVINLVKKSNKNIVLHKFDFSGAFYDYLSEFIEIENLHDLMFTYNDPVKGDYHEVPFKPNLYSPFDQENKHNRSGITWWTTWIRFEVETVDAVKLVDIIDISGKQEPTICTSNNEEEITLNLSVINSNGPRTLRLSYRQLGSTYWSSEYLGNYKPQFKVKLKDLFYSNIPYGEDIQFKIVTDYSYSGADKLESGILTRTFYAQIPPFTVDLKRTACGDQLFINLPSGYGARHNEFVFKLGTENEDLSNNNKIEVKQRTGDRLQFDIPNDFGIIEGKEYVVQIAQSIANDLDDKNPLCKEDAKFTAGPKPTTLALSYSLKAYSFTDDFNNTETYHITKKGANDGKANLTIDIPTRLASYQWQVNNAGWASIPSEKLSNTGVQNTKTLSSLKINTTYQVKAIDTDGCPSTEISFSNLKEPEVLQIYDLNSTKVTCHINNEGENADGVIRFKVKGGIGPFSLTLKDPEGNPTAFDINKRDFQIDNQKAGAYTLTVSDNYNSRDDDQETIQSNPEIKLNITPTDVLCHAGSDGALNIAVTGNNTSQITYQVTNQPERKIADMSTIFDNLKAGNYDVKVINTNGCSASGKAFVSQPQPIKIEHTTTKIARYGDATGAINTNISGGTAAYDFTYKKAGNIIKSGNTIKEAIAENLTAGDYSLSVVDDHGCPANLDNIVVLQPEAPLSFTFTKKDVDCFGNNTGSVTFTAKGGWGKYQYGVDGTVKGGNPVISGIAAKNSKYKIFVKDSAGIIEEKEVLIIQPAQLIASVDSVHHLLCFNDQSGAVRLNVAGGVKPYTFSSNNQQWVNASLFTNLPARNSFTFYVKDNNQCISSISTKITQPPLLEVKKQATVNPNCSRNDGSIEVSSNGGTINAGYRYSWYSFETESYINYTGAKLDNLYSGKYKVWVEDDNQCRDSLVLSLSDLNGPSITKYRVDSITCFNGNDGAIFLQEINGGTLPYTYFFENESSGKDIAGLTAGTYQVRVEDNIGCKADEYIEVPQPDSLQITSFITAPTCHDYSDGTLFAAASGGNGQYQYEWNNGIKGDMLDAIPAGSYPLWVTDWKGCTASADIIVEAPLPPLPPWEQNSAVICTGRSIVLDGGDFITYRWFTSEGNFSDQREVQLSTTGTYYLEVQDVAGCVAVDTFLLEVSDHPLDAVLLLSDSAFVNDTIKVVDVTWPKPDSIEWLYSPAVYRIAGNSWSDHFYYDQEASVQVTLRAFHQGCYSDTTKSIIIYSTPANGRIASNRQPVILGFLVFPNPSDGNFQVKMRFSKPVSASLELMETNQYSIVNKKEFTVSGEQQIPYQLTNLSPGIYFMRLAAGGEEQIIKVMIK